ncbi:MAG TPA: acyl-CoA dehydrogenase family protein [Burkholderiaceae bacterium]|nr:acyl-CoA dehydrogenase family protein [Burkholderiaceae bacterium]
MSGGEHDALIEHSVQRLFADQVDKGVRERAEAGVLDHRLWRLCVDGGLTRALASEATGGIAASWSAAQPILHGLGYWQVPLPLAETMAGALLLSMAGLPGVEGPIALIEQGVGNDLQAAGAGAAVKLTGTVPHVAWARHADSAVVSLSEGRLALVELRARGVSCAERLDVARLPSDTLHFDNAACVALAALPASLRQPVWTLGALARSLMMVGALESALEQAVRYANERVQFGKPIGKNQALQQQLALMAGDVAAARMAALVAASDAPDSTAADAPAATFSIAVAKVRCGEAATRACGIAHQVHGAIGFTREHPLHFATRRLWAWREQFGSDAFWAARLGALAIAGGSRRFWPSLTRRRFDAAS